MAPSPALGRPSGADHEEQASAATAGEGERGCRFATCTSNTLGLDLPQFKNLRPLRTVKKRRRGRHPGGCRPRSGACVTFSLSPGLPLPGPLCRTARRRSRSGLPRCGGCHLFPGSGPRPSPPHEQARRCCGDRRAHRRDRGRLGHQRDLRQRDRGGERPAGRRSVAVGGSIKRH